jgi:hypothetical protein
VQSFDIYRVTGGATQGYIGNASAAQMFNNGDPTHGFHDTGIVATATACPTVDTSGLGDVKGPSIADAFVLRNQNAGTALTTTTIRASGGSSYSVTTPNALPGSTSVIQRDPSGVESYIPAVTATLLHDTLVGGTKTVPTAAACDPTVCNVSPYHVNAGTSAANLGQLYVSSFIAGVSVTITSSNGADDSQIGLEIK